MNTSLASRARWAADMGMRYPLHDKKPDSGPEHAACAILAELSDRGGFDHILDDIDKETREDIVETMAAIIRECVLK